jgi:hypothetical protein
MPHQHGTTSGGGSGGGGGGDGGGGGLVVAKRNKDNVVPTGSKCPKCQSDELCKGCIDGQYRRSARRVRLLTLPHSLSLPRISPPHRLSQRVVVLLMMMMMMTHYFVYTRRHANSLLSLLSPTATTPS